MIYLIPAAIIALDLIVRLILRRPGSGPVTPQRSSGFANYLRLLVNAGCLLALAAAAITAPASKATGDVLLRHVTVAPAFAIAAVVAVFFWAQRNRFVAGDGVHLLSPATWAAPLRKFFFWIAVALAIPTILAILAAMFPLFGSDDQPSLVLVHRYCAQATAIASILFAYFALAAWREGSGD